MDLISQNKKSRRDLEKLGNQYVTDSVDQLIYSNLSNASKRDIGAILTAIRAGASPLVWLEHKALTESFIDRCVSLDWDPEFGELLRYLHKAEVAKSLSDVHSAYAACADKDLHSLEPSLAVIFEENRQKNKFEIQHLVTIACYTRNHDALQLILKEDQEKKPEMISPSLALYYAVRANSLESIEVVLQNFGRAAENVKLKCHAIVQALMAAVKHLNSDSAKAVTVRLLKEYSKLTSSQKHLIIKEAALAQEDAEEKFTLILKLLADDSMVRAGLYAYCVRCGILDHPDDEAKECVRILEAYRDQDTMAVTRTELNDLLGTAIKNKKPETATALILAGAEPDHRYEEKSCFSAVCESIWASGFEDLARAMLTAGANVNGTKEDRPIRSAACDADPDKYAFLVLEFGADLEEIREYRPESYKYIRAAKIKHERHTLKRSNNRDHPTEDPVGL